MSVVVLAIFLAIGKWYPGSRSRAGGLAADALARGRGRARLDDVDQMLEAQNARRRASGRPELTEDDVRAQVAEDAALARRADGAPRAAAA